MNVLISGGFVFIGSYLTPYFLRKGANVGVITRRVPETFRGIAQEVDCYVHDVGGGGGGPRLRRQYDCFVHLAGAVHSAPPLSDPLPHAVGVTRTCLEICRANGIPRFIHFSTFQVYGRDEGNVDEDTPVACRNDYAAAHHLAEGEVMRAHRGGLLDYAILRPTNCFGFSSVHMDVHRWSLVPSCFCRSAVEQDEIVLRTSGRQQKDFIHLEQVAGLTYGISAMFDRFKNQATNLASGCTSPIIDVAASVRTAYERLANRSCAFRVLSDEPPVGAALVVSRRKTADLHFSPSGDLNLSADIMKTLAYLRS